VLDEVRYNSAVNDLERLHLDPVAEGNHADMLWSSIEIAHDGEMEEHAAPTCIRRQHHNCIVCFIARDVTDYYR
jgi:hypothetical protein